MSAPAVSVIIASHRAVFIGELLAGLDKQADPHPAFEVIAVCDYDPAAIKTGFPEVTFIYHNDRSISAKRNRGVRAARADIVAFIDDDCVPSANWIAAGIAHLAANPISAGVEGLTTIENTGNLPPSARDYHRLERPGYRTNNIFYRLHAG
ncbi:MAG: glycosyltransferase family 2 protein, partial [Chitinispirillaceae bacterium]|nr:glycosyltransferase family 2 protein [Chitinispirillaceae bacterium]